MRIANLATVLALLCAPLPLSAQAPQLLSKEEAFFLVNSLLQLTDDSKDAKQSLSKYKEWETQYIKVRDAAYLGEKQLALYFFVVFIAEARAMTYTSQEISHEVVPLYMKNKERFWSVLNINPAFIPAVCRHLGGYFVIEGKKTELSGFIAQNKPLMEKHLYKPHATTCISELQK
jgi:hypothetical protein